MEKPELGKIETLIVGAGVIGAALAQKFASAGVSVIVLEKFDRIAEGVTSRNSGVVHSGIYYPPHSLKARLCIRGKELLYDWVKKSGVPHLKTGKLILSTNPQEDVALDEIWANAIASGATGLSRWTSHQIANQNNELKGTNAIFASETGIIDAFAFTRSLFDDAEQNGAMVLTNTKVKAITRSSHGYRIETSRGPIEAACVLNAAGLYSDEVAAMVGIDKYKIHPCRGDYFRLKTQKVYKHLIYPVKAKGAPGLGIHLTLDLSGSVRLGPDAEYVKAKDDFSPREEKLELFRLSAEKLLGPIKSEDLVYDQCGIRPKLRSPSESAEKDFVISEDFPGFVNLVGIESPGLTSALAIAEVVSKKLV